MAATFLSRPSWAAVVLMHSHACSSRGEVHAPPAWCRTCPHLAWSDMASTNGLYSCGGRATSLLSPLLCGHLWWLSIYHTPSLLARVSARVGLVDRVRVWLCFAAAASVPGVVCLPDCVCCSACVVQTCSRHRQAVYRQQRVSPSNLRADNGWRALHTAADFMSLRRGLRV